MNNNKKIKVLIVAAGKGTRANLPYPKTLFKINGEEILLKILNTTNELDPHPTVIVSPKGKKDIKNFLFDVSKKAYLVIQEEAKGMGDAVMKFEKSPAFESTDNILLIWGDIPYIKKRTIQKMVEAHFESKNIFTFVTAETEAAYTRVIRDQNHKILDVIETREERLPIKKGERDIGLFIFKKNEVFNLLKMELQKKYSYKTKEHGFLYLIHHLVEKGFKVEALKIADKKELISLNKITDLNEI